MYEEVTDSVYMDTEEDRILAENWRENASGNAAKYEEKYEHPLWKEYMKNGLRGGHSGIDWLEFEQFFKALRNDEPIPIDVYDAASWMAITALSEMSVARGGAVVDIPDFTSGNWHRKGEN